MAAKVHVLALPWMNLPYISTFVGDTSLVINTLRRDENTFFVTSIPEISKKSTIP